MKMKVRMKSKIQARNQEFFWAKEISWNRGTSINTSFATCKRRAPQGVIFVFLLQETLKTAFQMKTEPIDAHKVSGYFLSTFIKNREGPLPSALLVARVS